MRARSRRRSAKSYRWLLVLAGLAAVCVVGVLLMPMLVMNWVQGYLRQESFRGKMEAFFGTQVRGEVSLTPLRWTGDAVLAEEAGLATANGWKGRLDGLHLTLDWNAFRQGTWRVVGSGADSLVLEKTAAQPVSAAATSSPVFASEGRGGAVPSWLQRYLPDRTEVDGIAVDRVTLLHPGPWNARDAKLRISPWQQGETSAQAVVEGGIVETPLMLPAQTLPLKFNLVRASLRLSREDLHLKEGSLKWLDAGDISVQGHLRPTTGEWDGSCQFTQVPLSECLTADWRVRLSGRVEGDMKAKGSATLPPQITGTVHLREGVLTALPVLDRLASYTGVERFKRLVLDTARTEVRLGAATRYFDKILLQSNGLLHVEGSLQVTGDQISGDFLLGVTAETLKWIPGAQQHVFTAANPAGPAGLVWTPLRISGTVQAPREDLSTRLAAAAGRALLDVPAELTGTGAQLLLSPVLGKDAAALPTEVIKGATDTGGKAVETGVKLLEGFSGGLLGR